MCKCSALNFSLEKVSSAEVDYSVLLTAREKTARGRRLSFVNIDRTRKIFRGFRFTKPRRRVCRYILSFLRMNLFPNEAMKRFPMPITPNPSPSSVHGNGGNVPATQDFLWISKQQQQHPSIHAHPLKNTIRLGANSIRHKFDGKQWRPLCESPDGYECRNLAFRSALCQKHFYKLHVFKRPYLKSRLPPRQVVLPLPFKRPISHVYGEHPHYHQHVINKTDPNREGDDDDSIQLLENYDVNDVSSDRIM